MVDNTDQGGTHQITLVSLERWNAVSHALGPGVTPILRRANLLVSGVALENSRGRILRVGACRLRIRGETRPCERMDEAHPGLRAALDLNCCGGAHAEVLDDGMIAVGDEVRWDNSADERPDSCT